MRAVLQRVSQASVEVRGEKVAAIGPGLVVLLAFGRDDSEQDVSYIVDKTIGLRIFPDSEGKFDRSALAIGAELLVVSQVTLYGDTRKGRRPSFASAATAEQAADLFTQAVDVFRGTGLRTVTGIFQEKMNVSLVNDGPVTIWLDSADRLQSQRG